MNPSQRVAAGDRAMPALAVVMHDVAPATLPAVERVLALLREREPALPVTQLVVPRWHGQPSTPQFDRWLDEAAARGDELVLHGYTHRDDGRPRGLVDLLRRRVYTAGEGEFAALDARDAARRLRQGRLWFAAGGWPLHGFVAPAWLMSEGTWEALADAPFDYTCTLRRLVSLPGRRAWRCRSLVYSTRAAWRRAASCAWNAGLARLQRQAPLLRLELHPPDADHAAVRQSWSGLLDAALRDGRQPLTLHAAVRQLARERPLGSPQAQA